YNDNIKIKKDTYMNYNIRGENTEVTQPIREYAEKKIGKLNRSFDNAPSSDVHVNLSVYNEEQQIAVTIPMTDLLLRAEEEHTDLYAAIDLAVDTLVRQRRRYNEEQQIEVTIPMTDLLLRAEEEHTDLYAAIDLVVDKLERQIRKYKTKINRKFRQKGGAKYVFAELEQEAQEAQQEAENEIDI